MADLIMVSLAVVLSLMPFYMLSDVNASVIAIIFVASMLSALLLLSSTAAERQHLFMIPFGQSFILGLGALVAEVSSCGFMPTLDLLFRVCFNTLVARASDWRVMITLAHFSILSILFPSVLIARYSGSRFLGASIYIFLSSWAVYLIVCRAIIS